MTHVTAVVALHASSGGSTRSRRAVTRQMANATTVVASTRVAWRSRAATHRAHAGNVTCLSTAIAFASCGIATRFSVRALTRHMTSLVATEASLGHWLVRAVYRDMTLLSTVVTSWVPSRRASGNGMTRASTAANSKYQKKNHAKAITIINRIK